MIAQIEPPAYPSDLRDRADYARQRTAGGPDFVTFTIPRSELNEVWSVPARRVPGVLTSRPQRREDELPPPRQP